VIVLWRSEEKHSQKLGPVLLQTHSQKGPRSKIRSNQRATVKILNRGSIWNLAKSNTQSGKAVNTCDYFTQKKIDIEFDTFTPLLILLFIQVVRRFLPRKRPTSSFASTSNQGHPKYSLFWTRLHRRNSNQASKAVSVQHFECFFIDATVNSSVDSPESFPLNQPPRMYLQHG
jgi:hypothetical protein